MRGIMVYAVTGVPLIHGVGQAYQFYGLVSYGSEASWRDWGQIDAREVCSKTPGNVIVSVDSLVNPRFSEVACSKVSGIN